MKLFLEIFGALWLLFGLITLCLFLFSLSQAGKEFTGDHSDDDSN